MEQALHKPQTSLQGTTPFPGAQLLLGSWSITGLGQGNSSTYRILLVCGILLAGHPPASPRAGGFEGITQHLCLETLTQLSQAS